MSSRERKQFLAGIGRDNPVFVQILGICSTLAVTNVLRNTVVMCIGLCFTLTLSNVTVSALRRWIPGRVRMMVEVLIIATYVIVVDILLKAYLPDISRELGPYVGLIITNCIVMGRAEAFALANKPLDSFFDGIGNGLGYTLVLVIVALIREFLGSGKFLGFNIIPQFALDAGYQNMGLMVLAPGAFFIIGLLVWLKNSLPGISKEER